MLPTGYPMLTTLIVCMANCGAPASAADELGVASAGYLQACHEMHYLKRSHCPAIEVPVLLLRGAESDLVLQDTVPRMRERGPGARGLLQTIEVPGCGHAPALNVPQQLDWVTGFIESV